MPELSATALFGFVLTVLYFALGTATVYQANTPLTTSKSGTAPPKDVPNIVFGSLFTALAVMTFRAIFMTP